MSGTTLTAWSSTATTARSVSGPTIPRISRRPTDQASRTARGSATGGEAGPCLVLDRCRSWLRIALSAPTSRLVPSLPLPGLTDGDLPRYGDHVEVDHDGTDLTYVIEMTQRLWESTRTEPRTSVGFEPNGKDSR